MRIAFSFALVAAALTAGACSKQAPQAEAPPGAMEDFADKQADDDAAAKDADIEAARARETDRAADARQKVQAAEGIDRFERSERALEASTADKGG